MTPWARTFAFYVVWLAAIMFPFLLCAGSIYIIVPHLIHLLVPLFIFSYHGSGRSDTLLFKTRSL